MLLDSHDFRQYSLLSWMWQKWDFLQISYNLFSLTILRNSAGKSNHAILCLEEWLVSYIFV